MEYADLKQRADNLEARRALAFQEVLRLARELGPASEEAVAAKRRLIELEHDTYRAGEATNRAWRREHRPKRSKR